MLLRFDPFRDLDRVTQLVTARPEAMPMDAYREADHFVVHFDLPGVDPSAIDLAVEKNVLTVRAERSWQPNDQQEVLVAERPQGSFSRQLFLGDSLDADQIRASYERGVLTLSIPVAEQEKARKVEITVDGSDRVPVGAGAGSGA
ncbi:MAG TPA: Hsp20/alpha crystallin family protein [Acidimicrobiales bacterium]|nr:Hsp20/alpha crystallin family protein [Acidimicrobiales bacterium]